MTQPSPSPDERLVYVLPQEALAASTSEDLDLGHLWQKAWRGKWIVLAWTAIFALAGVTYALLATEWFKADVLLSPAEERTSQGLAAQFGGLASLAGITVGSGESVEPLAILRSREFAREFITDNDLLPVLLSDQWDAATGTWKEQSPDDWPDIRDAVKFFDENVRSVAEDAKTGLITLSIEWTDPDIAAQWANTLVQRLNSRTRQRALVDAERNVGYLQSEMQSTSVISMQQSISRLLEAEMQKLMLARGNEEFSFRVIDRAEPPKERSKPRRMLVVLVAVILGGLIGLLHALVRDKNGVSRGH